MNSQLLTLIQNSNRVNIKNSLFFKISNSLPATDGNRKVSKDTQFSISGKGKKLSVITVAKLMSW